MSDDTKKTPSEQLVKFLNQILHDRDEDAKCRVDAGLTLLAYYTRERRPTLTSSDALRYEYKELLADIRAVMFEIASDDDIAIEQRIRAAGASL